MTSQSLHNLIIFMRNTKSHAIMRLARYKFMDELNPYEDSYKLYMQKNKNEFESMMVLVKEALRVENTPHFTEPLIPTEVPEAAEVIDWNLLRMPEHYYGEVSMSF